MENFIFYYIKPVRISMFKVNNYTCCDADAETFRRWDVETRRDADEYTMNSYKIDGQVDD